MRAQPFLQGAVGEQGRVDRTVMRDRAPAVPAVHGVVDVRVGAVLGAVQRPYPVGGVDDDLVEAGQRQEQRVVDGGEQPADEVLGDTVAQRQHDHRVVPVRCGALGGQGEPEQRYVTVAAAEFVTETGAAGGGLLGEAAGLGEGPADPTVPADDGGLVTDREHGGEPDTEPADGGLVALALGGGPERAERFDAGGVEGAPVLAAARTAFPASPGCRVRRRRPGTPARAAASAAFWASSTTRRSR